MQKTDPRRVKAKERDAIAVKLRREGLTFEQIATKLGYANKGNAYRGVRGYLDKLPAEDVAGLRQLEAQRLDLIVNAIWKRVEKGDLSAIDRMLAVIRERSRLFGLDAPSKHEYSAPTVARSE